MLKRSVKKVFLLSRRRQGQVYTLYKGEASGTEI